MSLASLTMRLYIIPSTQRNFFMRYHTHPHPHPHATTTTTTTTIYFGRKWFWGGPSCRPYSLLIQHNYTHSLMISFSCHSFLLQTDRHELFTYMTSILSILSIDSGGCCWSEGEKKRRSRVPWLVTLPFPIFSLPPPNNLSLICSCYSSGIGW